MSESAKPNLLFIDDDANIRNLLQHFLNKDFNVYVTETGEAGLEVIRNHSIAYAIIDYNFLTSDIFVENRISKT